jgi:bifunctional enzyme CysN/CysC
MTTMSHQQPAAALDAARVPFRIVVVGHVDHGKSTLVGRILSATGALDEGKVEYIKDVCRKRGMPFEWAFVMDALQAERDQGITIDTCQLRFRTKARPYVIIDAPGHKEFLKNMITGAASAEAAVLVIDAHEGVQEQSRRHGYLLHLLGLEQIAVAINKMDLVGWDQTRFNEVKAEITAYLAGIGVRPTHVVPISARTGDNVAGQSLEASWYDGPTVLDALDGFRAAAVAPDMPLRLPVQDVYKFDTRRIVAGRIESGRLKVGDTLVFSPSGKSAKIASIEAWAGQDFTETSAAAGQSVGITLDDQIFVERGQIAHHPEHPPRAAHELRARVFWLGKTPLEAGHRLKLKLATAEAVVEVTEIERVLDVTDLAHYAGTEVPRNAVAEVVLRARVPIPHESFTVNAKLGRFVLVGGWDIVGGGVLVDQPEFAAAKADNNLYAVDHKVLPVHRSHANGHRGGVVWLTGLSGSGKSTIAMEVERRLFLKGWQVTVLDGDNVRQGLCQDLGFAPADRTENIRRVGEVAHLMANAGLIVLTSFISPYRTDREKVRHINPKAFHEIHVAAGVETCEKRDPKGLYAQARAGRIPEFTGISAPYEAPVAPALVLDTASRAVDDSVGELVAYIERNFTVARTGEAAE